MSIKRYIESGILESYCLGELSAEEISSVERMCAQYPIIREELRSIEIALEKYAEANAVQPADHVRDKVAKALTNLEKEKAMHPDDLPHINENSDYKKWQQYVADKMPADLLAERSIIPLRKSKGLLQLLMVSTTDFENETHENEIESFLVLEGRCECNFGGHIFQLSAGQYIAVPLHTDHTVKMITPYVAAIVQYEKV